MKVLPSLREMSTEAREEVERGGVSHDTEDDERKVQGVKCVSLEVENFATIFPSETKFEP